MIGAIELLGLAASKLTLHGGFWDWVATVNVNTVGYIVFALFALTWAVALALWRLGHIEERWTTQAQRSE